MAIVRVTGVPAWVDHRRLLDDQPWEPVGPHWVAERTLPEATAIAERLRNVGIAGHPIQVQVEPPPRRSMVRAARLAEARARRERHAGFTRPGARLDADGRVYLTPERLALRMARRSRATSVIDATAGCGGNAIAWARCGATVTAIELDRERLRLAEHNARLYGVLDRIQFVHGDARTLLPTMKAQLLFIDPPWGAYDPVRCEALPLLDALLGAAGRFDRVWAKVPPSYAPCPSGFQPEAWFGDGDGDRRRVKFLLLRRDSANHSNPNQPAGADADADA